MAATLDARVETTDRLGSPDLDAVTQLVEAATEADGLHPLSEHVMLHLRYGGEGPARHLLVFAHAQGQPEQLAAYAHLDPTDEVEGSSAEIVVHPRLRRHGIGRLLVHSLEQASPDGRLRLWAHGQVTGARALAASLGYERARELWQMRRSLYAPLPPVDLPEGFALRTFVPGADDEPWLAVNAEAFADHPEQGAWTLHDLRLRMAEPWFDPEGFLVLDGPDGSIAGFHWTKVHGGDHAERGAGPDVQGPHAHEGHGHDPIGEVYVVGVSPRHQGHHLGRALTVAGLRHLRHRGLPQAMLYVDADNTAAIRTYTSLGFTRWDVDAMFARPRD
jgi:mycothiol synthase